MSNYPPGVTGAEYAISGPDDTWTGPPPGPCPFCEEHHPTVDWGSFAGEVWWTCPGCDAEVDVTTRP